MGGIILKSTISRGKLYYLSILTGLFFILILLPSCEAHVVIIADGDGTCPDMMEEAQNTADALNENGYEVLELYQENATTKNIAKGMYNADAVIYLGHGGYMAGHYDGNGGTATPPFAMVGSDGFLWGIDDKMREGWDGELFTAPYKSDIPVILCHACFSTGYVESEEVANPIETIYNFSRMFTAAGGNYYATAYYGYYQGDIVADIVDEFLNGATSFQDANTKNIAKTITQSQTYNGTTIWRNDNGYNAFVGNWDSTFPLASETTPYDDAAAELWYQNMISGNLDIIPPTIESTNPTDTATGVSLNPQITVNFSEVIMEGANYSGIYIKNLDTGVIINPTSTGISGMILTINGLMNSYGTNYQVNIPAGAVKDVAGNLLAQAYTFNFKTFTDNRPPVVVSTDPASGATGVSLITPITINFSEYITENYYLKYVFLKNLSTGQTVALASTTIKGRSLILQPVNYLLQNNVYKVYIPARAVKDGAGNRLESSYIFTFKTLRDETPPNVLYTSPYDHKIGFSTDGTITIIFSEKITTTSYQDYIVVKNLSTGELTTIEKIVSGKILYIKNTTLRSANSWYKVIIPGKSISDYAGNYLDETYSFVFKTR